MSKMQKYRKRPVVIEAFQWFKKGDHPEDNCETIHPNPDNNVHLKSFLSENEFIEYYGFGRNKICKICNKSLYHHGCIRTLEGKHIVCPGDYIITGIQGEQYPCKPDIFEATYEKVEES